MTTFAHGAGKPAACFVFDAGSTSGPSAASGSGTIGLTASMHAKMLRLVCAMTVLFGCFYSGYFLSVGLLVMAPVGLVCMALSALALGYANATGRYRAALELFSVLLFVLFAVASLLQDGVRSPALWWLYAPALIVLLAGSKWLGGTLCALFVVIAATLHLHGPGSWSSLSLLAADSAFQATLAMTMSAVFLGLFAALSSHWSRQVRRALDRARKAALAASAEKARFVSRVSHEIRTPLQGMIGATEVLQQPGLDAERRERLAEVQRRSAEMLMALVNDVLDFSKLEAGKVTFERCPVELEPLIRQVLDFFAPQAADKGVELTTSCSPDVPGMLLGDALRIRQIVTNLVSNAIKFTPHGSVHVHVGLEGRSRPDRSGSGRSLRVRIGIADSGVGIDEGSIASLFKPFHQADESITRRFGGTGLGLSIASDLARLMGGRIDVTSALNRGSTFTIVLPLAVPDGGAAAAAAACERAADVTGAAAGDARVAPLPDGVVVVVAEDDPANQAVVGAMLDVLNVTALLASDGGEVLSVLASRRVDAVLMDLHMPGLDGLRATRSLREREGPHPGARMPIIAMTGSTEAEDAAACLDAGMDAILTKPFALADLRRVLLEAVRPAPADALPR